MSRVLAQLLGVNEPAFRLHLQQLERAAGDPCNDIRLATATLQASRNKIRQLGLDPQDTTARELYAALQTRLLADEALVRSALKIGSTNSSQEVLQAVELQLNQLNHISTQVVVKQTVMKQLLKKLKPKQTMKQLGYRSMDSMIKHEPVAQLLAACQIIENHDWQEARLTAYAKLQAKDFETKEPSFFLPCSKQWPKFAANHLAHYKHNIISVPEMGSIVLLPMSKDLPGMFITTLVVSLHFLNNQRALSAYLKLHHVQPDFGATFRQAVEHEPMTDLELGGKKLSWRATHWLYGHDRAIYPPEVFEPHVQPEDLKWHDVESILAKLQPVFGFWEETEMLGLLEGDDTVSLNILDVAIGVCNKLGYAERVVHNMREALSLELIAQYLHKENLQELLSTSLGKQLAPDLEFD